MSAAMLTCILAWAPGIPEGQAEGAQEITAWSAQAQEANP